MLTISGGGGGGHHHHHHGGGGHHHGGGSFYSYYPTYGYDYYRPPLTVCPPLYAPVIGTDGRAYDNECWARAAGQAVIKHLPAGTVINRPGGGLGDLIEYGKRRQARFRSGLGSWWSDLIPLKPAPPAPASGDVAPPAAYNPQPSFFTRYKKPLAIGAAAVVGVGLLAFVATR